jgi:hypothetical protein
MSISVVGDGLLLNSKGDLVVGDGTAEGRLPVGSDGQILQANSSNELGVAWVSAPTITQKWATIAYGQVTASAGVVNVTISSIPQTYSDLRLIMSCVSTTTTTHQDTYIRINSNTTLNYHSWWQYYYNTSVGSTNQTGVSYWQIGNFTSPTQGGTGGNYHNSIFVVDFPNYTSTTTNKVIGYRGGYAKNTTTAGYAGSICFGNGAINSTSAITSVAFSVSDPATGNLARDSWYILLGVKR